LGERHVEASGDVLRRHLEHRRPAVSDERDQAGPGPRGDVRGRHGAAGLLPLGCRHRQMGPHPRRRVRHRPVAERAGHLPLPRRELRARRRDLPVRVQPRRLHRAQHGRLHPQLRDPQAAVREPDPAGLRALPRPDGAPPRHRGAAVPPHLLLRVADQVHRGLGHRRRAGHPADRGAAGRRLQQAVAVPRHDALDDGRQRLPRPGDRREAPSVRADPLAAAARRR